MRLDTSTFKLVVLMSVLVVLTCDAQSGRRGRQRNRNGSLPPNIQSAYQNAVSENQERSESTNDQDYPGDVWQSLTPTLPAPNEVECYVEVQTVEARGGRCTRLGGEHRPYICQSGPHFEFKPECQQRLQERRHRSQQEGAP